MNGITQEHLERFYELSLDLFCVAGSDGYFKFLNPAWEKFMGYDRKELLSRPYIEFVHPDDKGATAVEAERLSSGNLVLHFENRYQVKDGSYRWLSWMAAPQESGEIYAVARDITAQKEDEKAAQELLRKLELSNQELDQFAYIVSHDLKTPLRGIINLAEWIVEDMGTDIKPEVAEHLQMLQVRVEWIQSLINDLLKYARTGRNHSQLALVSIDEVLAEVRNTLQIPKGFQINVTSPLPKVLGVRVELLQLFQNLLSNAVKYRSSDSGRVAISAEEFKDHWRFRVEDDGIGIAPRHHKKIFEVFQRLSEGTDIEGTGIGLAIVKKIIDAANGEIAVESDGQTGTTFIFTWPKNRL